MTLAEHQARVSRICFDKQPSQEDLDVLCRGDIDPNRWLVYRRLVRSGLTTGVRSAFPKTQKRMGDRFNELLENWLDKHASQERLFRNVPLEFYENMHTQISDSVCAEQFRYERERWFVKFLPDPDGETKEFSFEARPALNPASKLMVLSHPVHSDDAPDGTYRVIVYRDKAFRSAAFTLNEAAFQIVERWQQGDTMTQSVQHVMTARGSAVDAKFLESLSTLLADFLTRGILLGSWVD